MITLIIIVITLITSLVAFQNVSLFHKLLFNPYQMYHRKEWYRMFTHAFIHSDWMHLFMNMLVLYSFGGILENRFEYLFESKATLNYIFLYMGGIVLASFPGYEKHKEHPHYSSVGASGAVAAVVFSGILIDPAQGIYFIFIPFPIPGIIFGIGYLVYSAYMNKKGVDNIAHDAHFWGAVFGFIFTIILKPTLFISFIEQVRNIF